MKHTMKRLWEQVNTMENLETQLRLAINNESPPQSTSQLELQERWNHVIELYVQTESKGKSYLSEANFVSIFTYYLVVASTLKLSPDYQIFFDKKL